MMRAAGRGGAYPGTGRALVAGGSEMGAAGVTGAEWEALEGAGREFLAGHAAGNDGN